MFALRQFPPANLISMCSCAALDAAFKFPMQNLRNSAHPFPPGLAVFCAQLDFALLPEELQELLLLKPEVTVGCLRCQSGCVSPEAILRVGCGRDHHSDHLAPNSATVAVVVGKDCHSVKMTYEVVRKYNGHIFCTIYPPPPPACASPLLSTCPQLCRPPAGVPPRHGAARPRPRPRPARTDPVHHAEGGLRREVCGPAGCVRTLRTGVQSQCGQSPPPGEAPQPSPARRHRGARQQHPPHGARHGVRLPQVWAPPGGGFQGVPPSPSSSLFFESPQMIY